MRHHELKFSSLAPHLVQAGLLDSSLAETALAEAARQNITFASYLVRNAIVASQDILHCCARVFDFPLFDPLTYPARNFPEIISLELVRRYRVLPLLKLDRVLHLGLADPGDQIALDTVVFHTGLRIQPVLIAEEQLDKLIDAYGRDTPDKNLELSLLKELEGEPAVLKENSSNYEEPLIRFVDTIIQNALQKSASDIHIEPYENYCRIRYRQDGILQAVTEIPAKLASRLVTRLKVMAQLDISERRLPQDGHFQIKHHGVIDVRMNTCPTVFGEKTVLRLLDARKTSMEIDSLGLSPSQKIIFLEKISEPQGMILVTGPTGSGKTVTLYSALRYLNNAEKNISSVEDPVEIQLSGINQVSINPKIGLHFATALKTFLRQDPDILMVGEIRDAETAEIAIQAAQTGHLVLSTVHTNSSLETLGRLQSLGIAPFNLATSISLIISQRLLRKLCQHCRLPEIISVPTGDTTESFSAYRAQSCPHCLQGYQGRIGVYEFLPLSEALLQLISSGANSQTLTAHLQTQGFLSLRQMALEKVKLGITSLAEVNRVIRQNL